MENGEYFIHLKTDKSLIASNGRFIIQKIAFKAQFYVKVNYICNKLKFKLKSNYHEKTLLTLIAAVGSLFTQAQWISKMYP